MISSPSYVIEIRYNANKTIIIALYKQIKFFI